MAIYDLFGKNKSDEVYKKSVIESINHRGYRTVAPENTLPAYILSKKMGFDYVETDIGKTSDGVFVLLHNASIDGTSNGTGQIANMTFEQVRQYDFGARSGNEYIGTKIPSLDEFLELCRNIALHPYLELKNTTTFTQEDIDKIVSMVEDYGMRGNVTYISFSVEHLEKVKNADPSARLCYLQATYTSDVLTVCRNLKTDANEVFYECSYTNLTQEICDILRANHIPVGVYTVNSKEALRLLPKYVTKVTSDNLIASKVFYEDVMG